MCKRLFLLTSFVLVLGLVGSASAALPEGWQSQDIGTTDGSAEESDGMWAITADGADVWGSADEFHYAYMPLSGDGTIIAQVISNGEGSNGWAKGGVMIRETLDQGSKHAIMALTGGEGGGMAFQCRPETDSSDCKSSHDLVPASPPYWVKLTRVGNTFTGYSSADGVEWLQQPTRVNGDGTEVPVDIEMAEDVYIGLFATSHAAGELRTYLFDNVSIELPIPALEPVDPGTDNLIAYYPLDIDTLDASGNGNDGTVNGDPTFVDGMVATAMEFDGAGDFLDCGNNPILALTDAVSISAWIKVAVQNADHKVGGNQDGANGGYKMSVYNNKIEFEIRTSGNSAVLNRSVAGGTLLEVDVWYHVVGVYSLADGYIRTYVNGELDRELETTEALGASPGALMIGCEPFSTGQYNFNGVMDDIHVYNKALSEAEILYLAGKRATPVDPGTNGLVAYYAFENNADDSSGNELHGTLVGDATFAEGPPGYGMALDLDGDGDYVDCGTPPQLDITEQITFTYWIKVVALDKGWNTVLARGDDSWRSSRAGENNFMEAAVGGTSGNYLYGVTPVDDDKWHHVGAVYDGATFFLYVDGELDASEESIGSITASSYPLYIGTNSQYTLDREWTGLIDEVTIYNRALSVGEIRYLAGKRAVDPSLVIYYSFDEVGEIVADQSGKGHDGVVVGDVTAEADGMYNGAANFATGGYLDLDGPGFPAEDIPTSAMTLAAWIKCANTGGDHEIFNARASDQTWIVHPEPKSSGDIRWLLRSYGGTTIFQIRAGTMTWDEWLHFAGTYDKATAKAALYINGELIEEMDVENPADIAGDWGLGARVGLTIDNARPFTGLMDEFRMYTRALSQDEILEIMQGM